MVEAPISTMQTRTAPAPPVSTARAPARGSRTSSCTRYPALFTALRMLAPAVMALVTRKTSASRRTPLIPRGSLMPLWLSTRYSWGMAWSISRSGGSATARATTWTRSTSSVETSSSEMATTPMDADARTWSPPIPA